MFFIVFILLYIYFQGIRADHVYLIPDNYLGEIEIVYNQVDGEKINRNKRKYVFPIPKDGILKISNKEPEYGWGKTSFFYVDSNGEIIRELYVHKEIFGTRQRKSGDTDYYIFTVQQSVKN